MIVLASSSAVRARMLKEAGVAFRVVASRVDEDAAKSDLLAAHASPRHIAQHLARAKALAISAGEGDLIIGADQTLDLDGEILNKPADIDEARRHLRRLRGRAHTLHAAAALARDGQAIWSGLASPIMTMRGFSDAFLEDYLDQNGAAVLSSVGCYQLEGLGAQLFEAIVGDYFAVLGLPLFELLAALRREGALAA